MSTPKQQVDRLANFLMKERPDAFQNITPPGEGAVDMAIRLLTPKEG